MDITVFASEMRSSSKDNEFHGSNAALSEQWWALPAETRSDYCRRAASIRRLARCRESPLDSMLSGIDEVVQGPCGVASREGPFPIRPHALAEYLRGPGSTQRVASEWCQAPMDQCAWLMLRTNANAPVLSTLCQHLAMVPNELLVIV